MNKVKFLFVLVGCCFLPFNLHSQDNVFQLTVEEVRAKMTTPVKVEALKLIDENGQTIMFTNRTVMESMNNWFENATVQTIEITKETSFSIEQDESYTYLSLKDGEKLPFVFRVDGKTYKIGVGAGTKFVVKKTETGKVSKYILLPEETAELSPAPAPKPTPTQTQTPQRRRRGQR